MLNQFRSREGAELAAFIREQNAAIRTGAEEMQQIRAGASPHSTKRLVEKLQELLGNTMIDPQRLAQEAALLADRSDIGEEISRLQIHSRQLDEILDSGGEVGKRLDFLLQELNRETNTILSKTSGLGDLGLRITELALASKAAIEKIREQALNLENDDPDDDVFIISAPSGSGKSTLVHRLLKTVPNLAFSISYTTRPPRPSRDPRRRLYLHQP